MRFLLDTHVLLWWRFDPARVSRVAQDAFTNPGNELLWSVASTWEIAMKAGRGRLKLPEPTARFIPRVLREEGLVSLPVHQVHAAGVETLPLHHLDPFDRLLISQAQVEGVAILSADPLMLPYGVPIIW